MPGKVVELRSSEGKPFNAYLCSPREGRGPGVVVAQEIFGINAFIRQVCDMLAGEGYWAIAPDLFWRQDPGIELDSDQEADRGRAYQLYQGLDENKAVEDAVVALRHLRGLEQCTGKVGALGYCLGGKLAYLMATRSDVDAAVGYYGVGINAALEESDRIKVPVMLHVAGRDHLCPPPAQKQLLERFAAPGGLVQVIVHSQADHAFARVGSSAYREADARKADAATLSFLRRHLE